MSRWSALATSLLLSGCVVGPTYHSPAAAVPAHWSARPGEPDAAQALQSFWAGFDDPMLTSLIQRAIDSNYDLKIAGERIRAAHDAVRVAAAAELPQAGVGAAA